MGIAVPAQFVSTNDLIPTRNALSTMFAAINPTTGALPESGPPLSQQGSDTYHAWTLIGTRQSNFVPLCLHESAADLAGKTTITSIRGISRGCSRCGPITPGRWRFSKRRWIGLV